jgi:hypothetical protein
MSNADSDVISFDSVREVFDKINKRVIKSYSVLAIPDVFSRSNAIVEVICTEISLFSFLTLDRKSDKAKILNAEIGKSKVKFLFRNVGSGLSGTQFDQELIQRSSLNKDLGVYFADEEMLSIYLIHKLVIELNDDSWETKLMKKVLCWRVSQ